MPVIESKIDPNSEAFRTNREQMLALIGEFRALEQKVRDVSNSKRERFRARKQLLPRERIALVVDPGAKGKAAREAMAKRRAAASDLGVTTAAPEELVNEKVPLVIDASGNPDAPAMALNMLAHEGTLLIASWFGTKPVVLPLGGAFHRRRLIIRSTQVSTVPARLSGTWTRSRRRREAVELLAELPLAPLCTHVFAFGHAAEAFRAVDQGIPGLMHTVLDYDRSAAG